MAKKKVKVKKKARIFIVLFFLLLAIGCGLFLYFDGFSFKPEVKVEEKPKEEEKLVPKDYSAKVFMVGDALIHSSVYDDARQSDGSYDFKPMMDLIKPISSKYDLVYYNQETILGGASLGYSNYPRFNSPTEVGDAFVDAGFNLVSLATNHTMDKNEQGVINSVNYWKGHKNKVVYSGQWISEEERDYETSQIYEVNGIKYAFISYTIWTNGLETPYGKEYLNNVYSEEKAAEDIAKVKDKADFIIVAMHWGTEYSLYVDYKQEEIANYLSNLGVQLIIGAHPHVVEPVEYINDGKTLVIYSLGNFVSDQGVTERLIGLMMDVTLKKHVDIDDTVTLSVESPRAELIYTYSRYGRKFRVYPFSQLNDSILPGYAGLQTKYQGIVSSCLPELQWGVTGE